MNGSKLYLARVTLNSANTNGLCFVPGLILKQRDGPLWTPEGQFAPQPIKSNPSPLTSPRQEAYAMRKQGMDTSSQNSANFVSCQGEK